jgi:hypothetical protein
MGYNDTISITTQDSFVDSNVQLLVSGARNQKSVPSESMMLFLELLAVSYDGRVGAWRLSKPTLYCPWDDQTKNNKVGSPYGLDFPRARIGRLDLTRP